MGQSYAKRSNRCGCVDLWMHFGRDRLNRIAPLRTTRHIVLVTQYKASKAQSNLVNGHPWVKESNIRTPSTVRLKQAHFVISYISYPWGKVTSQYWTNDRVPLVSTQGGFHCGTVYSVIMNCNQLLVQCTHLCENNEYRTTTFYR